MQRYEAQPPDVWEDETGSLVDYEEAKAEIARLTSERDQARAQIAAVIEKIAAWHDENAAHDQGGIDYSDLVGISICNRYELEQSVKAHTGSARYVRALTPTDATSALNQMLNEAYQAGQRDMRERAAKEVGEYWLFNWYQESITEDVRDDVKTLPIKERNE